jgi:protein TonB
MLDSLIDPRLRRPLGYAVLFTFGVFWVMHLLIIGGKYRAEQGENLSTVDFIRLKKNSELETRTRQKPQKPPPPKTPPPPKMKVDVTPPTPNQPTPFALPKLDLAHGITGGPFLGGIAMGGDMGGTELIPIVRIAPQYPKQALRDGIEGYVQLEIVVNADGSVKSATPIKAQPRGVFETAAVQGAMKNKFRPKIENGKPVESKGTYTVTFKMEGDQK